MKILQRVMVAIGLLMIVACGSTSSSSDGTTTTTSGTTDAALAGDWRILSETVYYDSGLTQQITPVTTLLTLDAGGSWQFSSSSGTWSVADIVASDWTGWAIADYGSTRKLTLDNWNSSTSKGPVDEPPVPSTIFGSSIPRQVRRLDLGPSG